MSTYTHILVVAVLVMAMAATCDARRRTSSYYSMPRHNLANVMFSRRQTRMARYLHAPFQRDQFALVSAKAHWDNMVIIVDDSWRVGNTQFEMTRKLIGSLMKSSRSSHQHPDRLSMAMSVSTLSHPYYAKPLTNNVRTANNRLNRIHFGGGLVDKYKIEKALRTASRLLLNEGGDRLVVLLIDANNMHPSNGGLKAQYPTALTLRENGVNIVVVAMGSNLGGVQQRGISLTGDTSLVIPTAYTHYDTSARQVWHRVAQAVAKLPVRS